MSEFKLAIIGECMAEISGRALGTMQQSFGGDTLNTALYLKTILPNTGLVSYVTAMGEDGLSQAIIGRWQDVGIDTTLVLIDPKRQVGLYMIENDNSGERTFQYWRNDSAARYLMRHKDLTAVFEKLSEYDTLFLSGISLAILPDKDKFQLIDALKALKQQGAKIIFDGNYRPKLWADKQTAQMFYNLVYPIADLALITFDDEQLLWGDANIEVCRERLLTHQIPHLVLKDGANGCYHTHKRETLHIPTTPIENVIDTTAAGDSFNAGFLAGWLTNKPVGRCGELGNKVAGQVIQQKGAIVPLNLTQLAL
ncbi:sugar kinase [Psychrosphaera sp. B3R10]|uniref:sugar kinase n=1 Tax=unclassified Psychrosphaera TaxID=2641570 RepID=UPI001C098C75|nr:MULTISPECIES: sugar kinase [unclassified Psychrosphaera]MBU2881690.1 sugar kinase [Psychrosphaera sp. I2R16]MBU2991055.1 sugar kinase [Psychrosphaera sp. B3R10]MDO6718766.1 sugar kinase [Psychrosphaera sp. 1_MG-2023]